VVVHVHIGLSPGTRYMRNKDEEQGPASVPSSSLTGHMKCQ
jgi:hypothetical protein